jgi:hypothetical protein
MGDPNNNLNNNPHLRRETLLGKRAHPELISIQNMNAEELMSYAQINDLGGVSDAPIRRLQVQIGTAEPYALTYRFWPNTMPADPIEDRLADAGLQHGDGFGMERGQPPLARNYRQVQINYGVPANQWYQDRRPRAFVQRYIRQPDNPEHQNFGANYWRGGRRYLHARPWTIRRNADGTEDHDSDVFVTSDTPGVPNEEGPESIEHDDPSYSIMATLFNHFQSGRYDPY